MREGHDCSLEAADPEARCGTYRLHKQQCKASSPCLNSCNHRGKCITGFCHCTPGFWGADCSISKGPGGQPVLLAGHNYTQRMGYPRIYVYELPPNITSWQAFSRQDRPLDLLLWQRFLSAGVRTLDGDAADFYYVPLNTRLKVELVEYALRYVRRQWPWWSRDQGAKHLLLHTGDLGIMDLPHSLRLLTAQTTWLTHWGLTKNHAAARWRAAHVPGKDIVVPVMLSGPQGPRKSPLNPANGITIPRNETFFFAGRICGDRSRPRQGHCATNVHNEYSAGVRQRVHLHHRQRTGYKVTPNSQSYTQDFSAHVFCLAPSGGGHGKRNVLSAVMGCIPVTITDHILQPFEPEVPWAGWSVAVPEADIPTLHTRLAAFTLQQIAHMQARLRCMAQHMFYSTSLGSVMGDDGRFDAFETLLEILRMRMLHPRLPPAQYMTADERFRRFVNCEASALPAVPRRLCSQGLHPREPHPCTLCRRRYPAWYTGGWFYGSQGGLACCAVRELGKCTHAQGWA